MMKILSIFAAFLENTNFKKQQKKNVPTRKFGNRGHLNVLKDIKFIIQDQFGTIKSLCRSPIPQTRVLVGTFFLMSLIANRLQYYLILPSQISRIEAKIKGTGLDFLHLIYLTLPSLQTVKSEAVDRSEFWNFLAKGHSTLASNFPFISIPKMCC